MQAGLRSDTQSVRQLRNGHAAETFCGPTDRSIGSQSAPNEVAGQGHARRFRIPYEMGENVADAPTLTPGRSVPPRFVDRFNPIGELAAQSGHLVPHIDTLHHVDSSKP
jgi:hypothetical protein